MGDVATDVDGGRRYQHQPAAASWPDGDTGDIQPPGSGGGADSGTPHAATPARPRSAAVQPGDISTLDVSTLDISILSILHDE